MNPHGGIIIEDFTKLQQLIIHTHYEVSAVTEKCVGATQNMKASFVAFSCGRHFDFVV
jgi:hypothetical protein